MIEPTIPRNTAGAFVDFPHLYEVMRQTEMNDWVGGADPELTPYVRKRIAANGTVIPLGKGKYEAGGAVLIGNTTDRLAFIGYDIALLESMIADAGLIPAAIEYGDWRGEALGASFQDVLVCSKPLV